MRLRAVLPVVALVSGSVRLQAQIGPPMSPEIPVNSTTTNAQRRPAIGMDALGGFVVSWSSYQAGSGDVFAQRFAPDGQKTGPEFRVNSYTTGTQYSSAIAANPDGSVVVVWSSYGQGEVFGTDVRGQRFDASGGMLGTEFRINTYTTGFQRVPSVAAGPDGSFVVVWTGDVSVLSRDVF